VRSEGERKLQSPVAKLERNWDHPVRRCRHMPPSTGFSASLMRLCMHGRRQCWHGLLLRQHLGQQGNNDGNKIRCCPDAKRIRCPPFRPVDAWRRRKSDGHASGKLLVPPNGSLSFLAPRASACMARQRGCMHREAGNWNRPPRAEDMHAACCRALPTWCDWPKDHVAFSTVW